jgi:UDP-N-acetylmuramoyl-L-alanyl-D-glutamate--2,6-diaminopimelate ligase
MRVTVTDMVQWSGASQVAGPDDITCEGATVDSRDVVTGQLFIGAPGENVLCTTRDLARGGRLIVVFGCGGDRDQGKRPQMGSIARRLADVCIVTSDNPRGEDPDAIIAQVVEGAQQGASELLVQPDRRAAIGEAVGMAGSGDVVLIAGKGHESGQEVAGVIMPFDDRDVARTVLRERQAA